MIREQKSHDETRQQLLTKAELITSRRDGPDLIGIVRGTLPDLSLATIRQDTVGEIKTLTCNIVVFMSDR